MTQLAFSTETWYSKPSHRVMNHILSNINIILSLEFQKLRSGVAYMLLLLVSFSFIAEHIPFVEGDIIELVESAEKEKDIKDKKLIFTAQYSDGFFPKIEAFKRFVRLNETDLTRIYLDVSTPPPRQV